MKPYDFDFDLWQEILDTLEHAGMTDYEDYPEIYFAWMVAKERDDFTLLDELLTRDPWVLMEAKKKIKEFPFFQPKREEVHMIQGQFTLGSANSSPGFQVGLDPLYFTRGLFISGALGSGKSYPVLMIMDQMLKVPPKERGFNIITIQRIKRDSDGFAHKYPWFKVIEWSELRYNMWQVDDWDDPRDKLPSASTIFSGENFLYTITVPPMRYAVKRCYEKNGVFEGSQNFPTFSEILTQLPGYTKAYPIQGYEMTSSIGRLANRLVDFIEEGEVLNCKKGLSTQFFLSHDLCINVMDENEFTVRTTIMSILYDIQRCLQKNPLSHPAMRVLVVIEEARWLFDISRDRMDISSNKILEQWFTTSRESGFGRIVITQEPGSVSSFVTSNCAHRWSFPIFGKENLEAVESLNNLTEEQVRFIPKLKRFGEGIFSHPNFDRPFIIQVPPDLDLDKSVTREETKKIMRPFVEDLHAQLVQETPEKPEPVDLKQMEQDATAQKIGVLILRELKEDPFIHRTKLIAVMRKKYDIRQHTVGPGLDWLLGQKLIISMKCRSSTKDREHFPLTEKAQISLKIPERERISIYVFKHRLYCELVTKGIRKQGNTAIREYSSTSVAGHKRMDVLGIEGNQRIAYEISLSFSNLIDNITKCLELYKVDQVYIVCERQKPDLEKAMEIVSKNIPGHLLEKIGFRTISYFLS